MDIRTRTRRPQEDVYKSYGHVYDLGHRQLLLETPQVHRAEESQDPIQTEELMIVECSSNGAATTIVYLQCPKFFKEIY